MTIDGKPWGPRALPHLHTHLQLAIDLELWTIPFYAVALTSIRDQGSQAAALLRSILGQELVHVIALANIANAFGQAPRLEVPRYGGTIPHLRFDLDTPNPTSLFAPHSSALGPCDVSRLNAMCLIEYPAWTSGRQRLRHDDLADYASVGDFHDALGHGARELREHIRGNHRQLGDPALHVSKDRAAGYEQIASLLELVREQGEGARIGDGVPLHAVLDQSDPEPAISHFAKLNELRDGPLPELLAATPTYAEPLGVVEQTFAQWERLFADEPSGPDDLDAGLERITDAARQAWLSS